MKLYYIVATNNFTKETFNLAVFRSESDAQQFTEICPVWEKDNKEYVLTIEEV